MNDHERLQLQQMISTNNVVDQTQLIRDLKHSQILRDDINKLIMLKAKYIDDMEKLHLEAMNDCFFLYSYYTDIYNKIKKDEIDLAILFQFIDVLAKIELGQMDQHEASFEVGTLLKKIYIDSALKKAEKLNTENGKMEPLIKKPEVEISYKDFKKMKK